MNFEENTLKQEFDSIDSIDKFLDKLENNPQLVDRLSGKRLDILINYYLNITKENDEKIKKLKEKLANS